MIGKFKSEPIDSAQMDLLLIVVYQSDRSQRVNRKKNGIADNVVEIKNKTANLILSSFANIFKF